MTIEPVAITWILIFCVIVNEKGFFYQEKEELLW